MPRNQSCLPTDTKKHQANTYLAAKMLTLDEKITVPSNPVYPQIARGPWDLTLATGS